MQLINPKAIISVRYDGTQKDIACSADLNDADLSFSIEKDLSEEPNSAEFTLYNCNSDTMAFLKQAGNNESPVEFYASTIENPGGALKRAFAGEILRVQNENVRPGFESRIYCRSQKRNHREFWFQKTYASGTYADEITSDLLSTIGLPLGNEWPESTEAIILSKSFAGPAYELLQRFMFDRGMYCYIMDGKIYCSFVSIAPIGAVRNMEDYVLRGDPTPDVRTAQNLIEMKTVIEVTGKLPDEFLSKSTRKRRRKKKLEIYGQNDYVEFEATEQQIDGMIFNMFFQPDFNPDDMFRYNILLYRATRVEHEGDTFGGGWDTTVTTDIYEDAGGDFV